VDGVQTIEIYASCLLIGIAQVSIARTNKNVMMMMPYAPESRLII